MLSNSQKTLLAKLYFKDNNKYKEKATEWNVSIEDISTELDKERIRRNELSKSCTYKFTTSTRKYINGGYTYYMGGKPYCSATPIKKSQTENKTIIYIDGDNLSNEELDSVSMISGNKDIRVFCNNNNRCKKLKEKGIAAVYVPHNEKGDQAVDNRIKSQLGNDLKNNCYNKFVIISNDKGFDEYLNKFKNDIEFKSVKIKRYKNITDYINR